MFNVLKQAPLQIIVIHDSSQRLSFHTWLLNSSKRDSLFAFQFLSHLILKPEGILFEQKKTQ